MDDQEFNLRGMLGTLKRQALVIVFTVFVIVGITAAVVLSLEPIYRASTLVLVDPSDKNLLDPSTSALSGSAENARIESEVVIAKSETTLELVSAELRLREDPEFQPSLGIREQAMILLRMATPQEHTLDDLQRHALSSLRSAISISRQGATNLIEISAR